MYYIKTYPGYILENIDDVIPINKKDFTNGNKFPNFQRKDIILVTGMMFNPLSSDPKEVENGLKEITSNFNCFIVADTDLNAITFLQEKELYLTTDYFPLLRAEEIDLMVDVYREQDPISLLDNNHKKRDNVLRELMLFVNFETRYRKIFDIEYSENMEELKVFIEEMKEKGFLLIHSITPDDLGNYWVEINRLEKLSGTLDSNAVAYNYRNDYSLSTEQLSERDLKTMLSPAELYREDIEKIKERRQSRGDHYYFTLLEYTRNKIMDEFKLILEKQKLPLVENNKEALDFITAGRMSLEHLNKIQGLIDKREKAEEKFMNCVEELINKIDVLLKEKESREENE